MHENDHNQPKQTQKAQRRHDGGTPVRVDTLERNADNEPGRADRENWRGAGMRENDQNKPKQEQRAQRRRVGGTPVRADRLERNADNKPGRADRENWRGAGMRENDHNEPKQEQRAQGRRVGGTLVRVNKREINADHEAERADQNTGRGLGTGGNDRDRPLQEQGAQGRRARVAELPAERNANDEARRHRNRPLQEQRAQAERGQGAPLRAERPDRNAGDEPRRRDRGNGRRNDRDRPQQEGRGRGRNAGTGGHPSKKMNAKTLQELKEQEPSEIVLTLANLNNGFKGALGTCQVPLLLSVLAKAFTCNSTNEALNVVFRAMKDKDFFNRVIEYFMGTIAVVSGGNRQTVKQPIRDMITIMEELAESNPNSITEVLGMCHYVVYVDGRFWVSFNYSLEKK